LTGAKGQIGYELQRTCAPLGEVTACEKADFELADPDSIRRVVRDVRPNVIVNAAAYTAVDQAESEPALATAVNATAPGILAEEAKRLGASIVHYSTDYVFDGEKAGAYVEGDKPNPLSVYGRTKLAGEKAVAAAGAPYLVFRTSWIYGNRGRNFVLTMERLARERTELRVVSDQHGAPTWSRLVAEATALVIARTQGRFDGASGLYHLTCAGRTSWHEFACAIVRQRVPERTVRIHAIATSDYPTPARRPANSVLSCERIKQAFGIEMPSWEMALALCSERG
jgi:dTDP-4-dehydrorhamnose reductase